MAKFFAANLTIILVVLLYQKVSAVPSSCYQCITCQEENGAEIMPYLSEYLGSTAGVNSQLKSFDTVFELVQNFGGNRCPSSLVSEARNKSLDAEGSACVTMAFNFYGRGPFMPFESYVGCAIMGSLEDFYEDPQNAPSSGLTENNLYADLKKVAGSAYYISDQFTASISICSDASNCNDMVPGYETYEVLWELDRDPEGSKPWSKYTEPLTMWWTYGLCPLLPKVIERCRFDRLEAMTIRDDARSIRYDVLMNFAYIEMIPLNPMSEAWMWRQMNYGLDRLATSHEVDSSLDEYLVDDMWLLGLTEDDMLLNIYKVSKYANSNMAIMVG